MSTHDTPATPDGGVRRDGADTQPDAGKVEPPLLRRPPRLGSMRPSRGSLPGPRVPGAAIQGSLALALPAADAPAATGTDEAPRRRLNLVPPAPAEQETSVATEALEAWAARFAQAVVEVLGGDRPLAQLLRWTSARVYHDLSRRVRILGLTAPARTRMSRVRPQVRSVHVFRPTARAAEVSVHVRHGQRSRALAARLEYGERGWRCTALQLG